MELKEREAAAASNRRDAKGGSLDMGRKEGEEIRTRVRGAVEANSWPPG
jgi:hypothetical protein